MLIYCALCKKKVEVSNPTIREVPGKGGSIRKIAEGVCPRHNKPVSMYIPMNPKTEIVSKKVIRHKKKKVKEFWWE